MYHFLPLWILLFILLGNTAVSANELELGICNFPPFYVVTSHTEISGSKTDILRKVLNMSHVQFTEAGYPPKLLYNNLARGETHFWMGLKNVPIYHDHVLYSSMKTDSIEMRVYTRNGIEPPENIKKLAGESLIVIRGYSYGGLISYITSPESLIKVDSTNSHKQAFKKLVTERGNYFLTYKLPAEAIIQEEGFRNLRYSTIKKLDLYFVVSKKTPNAVKIMNEMEKSYTELVNAGEISGYIPEKQ